MIKDKVLNWKKEPIVVARVKEPGWIIITGSMVYRTNAEGHIVKAEAATRVLVEVIAKNAGKDIGPDLAAQALKGRD